MKFIAALITVCLYSLIGFFGLFYKGPERPELQKVEESQEVLFSEIDKQTETLKEAIFELENSVDSSLVEAQRLSINSKKTVLLFNELAIDSLKTF